MESYFSDSDVRACNRIKCRIVRQCAELDKFNSQQLQPPLSKMFLDHHFNHRWISIARARIHHGMARARSRKTRLRTWNGCRRLCISQRRKHFLCDKTVALRRAVWLYWVPTICLFAQIFSTSTKNLINNTRIPCAQQHMHVCPTHDLMCLKNLSSYNPTS